MASGCDIGLVGAGTMGAMLALNMAENGFRVSVYDLDPETSRKFVTSAGDLADRLQAHETLADFVQSLKPPRSIILLVPAGAPVDNLIAALSHHLDDQDLVIDAGNANFRDSVRRAEVAAENGHPFLGIGVSGGASGARFGPAIMAGGDKHAWERVSPILTAIAAQSDGQPCAAWVGPDGAGHFVKTVHNGIEYADMQMIAEVYGILRDGLALDPKAISAIFARWNEGPLQSYLIEITAEVAGTVDPESDAPVLDIIQDRAGQKGTGRWTLIEAQHLGAAPTVVEAAVAARNLSAELPLRQAGAARFPGAGRPLGESDTPTLEVLEQALIAAKIICYAQGFDLLAKASDAFNWSLPLPAIARLWRAGCIIRSGMLNDMAAALEDSPETNLLLAPALAERVSGAQPALRQTAILAMQNAIPAPALSAAVSYFDMLRSARSTANMIQGQRDFFGAHGFERTDRPGTGFHGPWHNRHEQR